MIVCNVNSIFKHPIVELAEFNSSECFWSIWVHSHSWACASSIWSLQRRYLYRQCGMQSRCYATTVKEAAIQLQLLNNGFVNKHVSTAVMKWWFLCGPCQNVISTTVRWVKLVGWWVTDLVSQWISSRTVEARSRVRPVGIATGYGLDDLGAKFESR
jgi:hypothetical protein